MAHGFYCGPLNLDEQGNLTTKEMRGRLACTAFYIDDLGLAWLAWRVRVHKGTAPAINHIEKRSPEQLAPANWRDFVPDPEDISVRYPVIPG